MDKLPTEVEQKIKEASEKYFNECEYVSGFTARDFQSGSRFGFRLGVEMAAEAVEAWLRNDDDNRMSREVIRSLLTSGGKG